MAVAKTNFGAQINGWVKETEARMTAVFRSAAQEVIEEMQKPVTGGGNMPVDTGFLRASLQVGVNSGPVPANRPNPNPSAPKGSLDTYTSEVASLAIAGANIGDTIYATYSANYGPHVEYGTSKMQARGFVRLAAAQWQVIVDHQTVRAMLTAHSNRQRG